MSNVDALISELITTNAALRARLASHAGVIEAAKAWWAAHALTGSYGDYPTCVEDYELVAALAALKAKEEEDNGR